MVDRVTTVLSAVFRTGPRPPSPLSPARRVCLQDLPKEFHIQLAFPAVSTDGGGPVTVVAGRNRALEAAVWAACPAGPDGAPRGLLFVGLGVTDHTTGGCFHGLGHMYPTIERVRLDFQVKMCAA
jgi:hypothetical protein